MMDNNGNLYFAEAILAIVIILMAASILNTVVMVESPSPAKTSHNFIKSQDIMEILSGKINQTEKSFIQRISLILEKNKNSKQSIEEVSGICKKMFESYGIENYQFSETNELGNKVLASSGNIETAGDVSVATRSYKNYFYTLSVWE